MNIQGAMFYRTEILMRTAARTEYCSTSYKLLVKGKAVPLKAWNGPEGSRKLRFPDFMTTVQNGGKVVNY